MERRFRAQERTNAIFRLEGRLEGANARAQEGSQGMRKTNARLKVRLGDSQGQEDRNQDQNLLTLGLEEGQEGQKKVVGFQEEFARFREKAQVLGEWRQGLEKQNQGKKRNRFRREKIDLGQKRNQGRGEKQIQGKNEIGEEEKNRSREKTKLGKRRKIDLGQK